jgi:rod shape-determining protein MreD
MSLHSLLVGAFFLFIGFVLEHVPMPEIVIWFQPLWLLLVVTLLVLNAPQMYGLWLAVPAGLMMDAEMGTLIGTHVFTFAVHIYLVQLVFKRFEIFNMVQQVAVIWLLALGHQVLRHWANQLIVEWPHPVLLGVPPLVTAMVWPWIYSLGQFLMRRLLR